MQDLLNIAPQRSNWDLKRDLNKRLAKLNRRDQEAINTLIRTSFLSPIHLFRLLAWVQLHPPV